MLVQLHRREALRNKALQQTTALSRQMLLGSREALATRAVSMTQSDLKSLRTNTTLPLCLQA